MKQLFFLSSLILLAILNSCQKDKELSINNTLVNNWTFDKFYDSNNKEILVKNFITDTINNFELNINFYNNYSNSLIEFEGHGPINLFQGSYNVSGNNLTYNDFEITEIKTHSEELTNYEKVFFDALTSVNNYKLYADSLVIGFGDAKKCMVFKKNYAKCDTSSIYFKAQIGSLFTGSYWNSKKEQIESYIIHNVSVNNNDTVNYYRIFLRGEEKYGYPNGKSVIQLDIILNPIVKGKYPIIEGGIYENGWASSGYFEWNKNGYSSFVSKSGEVEITEISKFFIKGKFNSIMTDHTGNAPLFNIFDGEFLVPISVNELKYIEYN